MAPCNFRRTAEYVHMEAKQSLPGIEDYHIVLIFVAHAAHSQL